MTGTGLPIALIGILMALWLVGAIVAIWIGLSMRSQSNKMLRQTARLSRLLETAPAFPVVVKGDGRIEAPDRFARLLGLDEPAASLSELGGRTNAGLALEDLAELEAKVRETQRTGKGFTLPLAIEGSSRRLTVVGNIADTIIYPNGAALLWFFDSTESLRELERRAQELDEARSAFSALAGLIEAAPIPMWHRRPDMNLHFVNHAYVEAVGVTDGLQVVEEGIELLEPENGKSAAVYAAEAAAEGVQKERIVSATLNGERRQLRVFDIPLGASGVAGLAIDVQDLIDTKSEVRELSEKSTLLDAVCGRRRRPTTGIVRYRDEDITRCSVAWRRRQGMARSFQRTSIFQDLTVHEQLHLVAQHLGDDRLDDVIEVMDLNGYLDQKAGRIAYGVQRRVDVALALIGRPHLLLMDEPGAGLSAAETLGLFEHLRDLVRERKIAAVVVEHDVDAVFACCGTVTVLDLGRHLATGSPQEIRADPRVVAAYLGTAA